MPVKKNPATSQSSPSRPDSVRYETAPGPSVSDVDARLYVVASFNSFESVPPCPRPRLSLVGAPPTLHPPNHVPRRRTPVPAESASRPSPPSTVTLAHPPPRPVRSRVHSSAVKLCLLVLFLFFILFLTVDLSLDTGVI